MSVPAAMLYNPIAHRLRFDEFPKNNLIDDHACSCPLVPESSLFTTNHRPDKTAIDQMKPGEAVVIFTPDRTNV